MSLPAFYSVAVIHKKNLRTAQSYIKFFEDMHKLSLLLFNASFVNKSCPSSKTLFLMMWHTHQNSDWFLLPTESFKFEGFLQRIYKD